MAATVFGESVFFKSLHTECVDTEETVSKMVVAVRVVRRECV